MGWFRRNLIALATAVAVMGGTVGAGALVLRVAEQDDTARDAKVTLAKTEPMVLGLGTLPLAPLQLGTVDRAQVTISGQIRAQLYLDARELEDVWPTEAARSIRAAAQRASEANEVVMSLLQRGRLDAARRANARSLQPHVEKLETLVRRSNNRLDDETGGAHRAALIGTLAITGTTGALLVLVVLVVSAARRRHERAKTERRVLRESEERLRALVEHGSDMITVVGPDTTVIYQAGAVRSMLGYEPHEIEGAPLADLVHPDDVSALVALCTTAGVSATELRLRHRDGSLRTCEARAASLIDAHWPGVVVNIWDVSQRKALEERLRHQAFHDALTGLANRALFVNRLEHALARDQRPGRGITVLLVDMDDFKSVNDTLGHAAGDRLLKEVAARLAHSMRHADTVSRLGGDEFGVILDDTTSDDDAERVASRLLDAFSEAVDLDGHRIHITASVGIVRSTPGESNADQIVRDADLAMYAAKAQGKSRWSVYHPEMHLSKDRLQLKADLLHAAAHPQELELHYQPVVAVRSGVPVGLEALLRWNHTGRGQISPADFIPLAEETGAIIPMGRWVLHEACRQALPWIDKWDRPLNIGVNVSARQLDSPSLVEDVRSALSESGLPPDRLVLEVTESVLMTDVERAVGALHALKELGVLIAIDDFGTGYSSLSQIERLPVDVLKVDRTLAGTSRDRQEHAALLRAILTIGQSLQLSTVAEGVETWDQLQELRDMHWPMAQGYLFSRPVPADSVDATLAAMFRGSGAQANAA